jgi:dTDP-4-amino-4,6-dideoxygalactose transaminase
VYADAPRIGGAVSEDLADRAISLPSSSSLTEADRERVIDALRTAVPST